MQSSDAGVTWTKCGEPQTGTTWYGLAVDPGLPNVALAATATGLFRSADGCKSWTRVSAGLRTETASIVLFHPKRPHEAYVSQGGKVFRSTDGGQQWVALDEGSNGNSGPSSLFILPEISDRLFALFPRRGVFSTSLPPLSLPVFTGEATRFNHVQAGGFSVGNAGANKGTGELDSSKRTTN